MASEDFNYPPDTTSGTELSNKLEKAFEIVSKAYPSTDGTRPDVITDHGRGFWTDVSVSPNVYYYYDGSNDWEVMKLDEGAQYAVYRGKYEIQDDDGSGNHWSIDENSSGQLVIDHPSLPGDGYIFKLNGLVESDDDDPETPSNDDELANKKYVDNNAGLFSATVRDSPKKLGTISLGPSESLPKSKTFTASGSSALIRIKTQTNSNNEVGIARPHYKLPGQNNFKELFTCGQYDGNDIIQGSNSAWLPSDDNNEIKIQLVRWSDVVVHELAYI